MSHTERMRVLGVADDGRAKRSRRVDRGSGDVDAEKMDGDKRKPDGDARKLDWRASLRHPKADEEPPFLCAVSGQAATAAPATAAPTSGSSETEQSAGVS
jgi:hypothetical protein